MSPITYNMRCPRGHLWYSPNPEAWVGQMCGHTHERRTDGRTVRSGRCESRITRIRAPKRAEQEIPY